MDDDVRLSKEAFVSGHEGTSLLEVAKILLVIPLSHYAYAAFQTQVSNNANNSRLLPFVIEFIVQIIPMLMVCVLEQYVTTILCTLAVLCLLPHLKRTTASDINFRVLDLKSTITFFRASVLVLTGICILAVDFNIFPRRLAKTEMHGVSLMDVGVGAFTFCAALVHPAFHFLWTRTATRSVSWQPHIILLVLGILRNIVNDSANYQHHITEYGRNWNFFITCGAVNIALSFIHSAFVQQLPLLASSSLHQSKPGHKVERTARTFSQIVLRKASFTCLGVGLAMVLLQCGFLVQTFSFYVCQLDSMGVPTTTERLMSGYDWVFHEGTRHSLQCEKNPFGPTMMWIAANREGILSLPGYIALSCFGMTLMSFSLSQNYHRKNLQNEDPPTFTFSLRKGLFISSALWGFYATTSSNLFQSSSPLLMYIFSVSRRLCNVGYVILILALALTLMTLLSYVCESNVNTFQSPHILGLVNSNALGFFVVSNLLTGLVNLSMNTLAASNKLAFFVLLLYLSSCISLMVPVQLALSKVFRRNKR